MRAKDLSQLRAVFLQSPEFHGNHTEPQVSFPTFIDLAPPIRVDVDADPETLRRLLDRVQRCWTQLGETQPHWSVLTHDQYKTENFSANAEDFYGSGVHDVNRLFAWLDRNDVSASHFESCLEFGCGTGRVTPWLARRFPRVFACDISAPHLQLAGLRIREQKLQNVDFLHMRNLETLDALPEIDVAFSMIVLQHNPPPVILAILHRIFQRLKPGGTAYFQVPTYGVGYRFDVQEYLRLPETEDFEMHVVPQRAIFRLADSDGCSVLEVEPDLCAGRPATYISNTFLVRKTNPSR